MDSEAFMGMVNNAALLLALAVLYDTLPLHKGLRRLAWGILTGVLIGLIGMAVMLTPWHFSEGVIFDTRSILLSLTGFFFGLIPTLIAALMTGALRVFQGGSGALMGVSVILTSAGLGLLWRYFLRTKNKTPRWVEFYGFGVVVHVAMLLWTFALPHEINLIVLKQISLPVISIYPIGTVLLGLLLTRQRQRNEWELALQQERDLLARISETSLDAILLSAPDGSIYAANPAACQMFGRSEAEIIETGRSGIVDASDPRLPLALAERTQIGRFSGELGFVRKNGQKFPGEISTALFKDHQGCDRASMIIRDITERKQAEEKLVQSHELLANLARLVPGVIYQYRLHPDGRSAFPYASPGMNDIYEVTPEEVQEDASPVFGRLHPDDYDRVANAIQESARTLQEFYCEFRVILPRQGLRWRWSQAHPERMADGGTLWHGIISDVTERKQAQEEIQQLNAELEQRVEERTRELRSAQEQLVQQERLAVLGRLAGGVAHELRNPLGIINNAIYYLRLVQPEAEAEVKEYLGIIETEAHHADKIISGLLDYSGNKLTDTEPVSVPDLVNQVLKRFPAPENVRVALNLPEDLPAIIIDLSQITQVLGNLVLNAYQAMTEGGTLTISAKQTKVAEQPFIKIAVKDTGGGTLPENMKKLFEPLFTTKPKGIGLGLAVSKKLIEANGGRIEVESEAGKGSTFTVYLKLQSVTSSDSEGRVPAA